jgi:hypothetical protein
MQRRKGSEDRKPKHLDPVSAGPPSDECARLSPVTPLVCIFRLPCSVLPLPSHFSIPSSASLREISSSTRLDSGTRWRLGFVVVPGRAAPNQLLVLRQTEGVTESRLYRFASRYVSISPPP